MIDPIRGKTEIPALLQFWRIGPAPSTVFRRYHTDSVGKPTAINPSNFTNLYNFVGNNPINRIDPLGLWYIDINLSWIGPWGLGGTGGFLFGGEGFYTYTGGSAGIPGLGGSLTWSPQNPTEGWNNAVGGGFGLGGQVGFDKNGQPFYEGGFTTPGGSNQTIYVSKWKWPWQKDDNDKNCPK